ncbi:MAG: hypothetical protein NW206_00250 [Hyphomonadaceae bacterium]|nr:hypothetical protein [Hyphomonadaceae bacterium]
MQWFAQSRLACPLHRTSNSAGAHFMAQNSFVGIAVFVAVAFMLMAVAAGA